MSKFHQVWKMVVLVFVLVVHILIGYLMKIFRSGQSLHEFQLSHLQRSARTCLAVLGIELTVEGDHHWREGQAYLVVSNHLSYIDMLLIASHKKVCFISTVEVRETPFLGQLAETSGSLFVERRSRDNIRAEIAAIENELRKGQSVAFFPEGTSTNGSSVLEFKRPLFAPAQRAGMPVLPVVVQPEELDGERITEANRDTICWYGDMDFAPHFFALAGFHRIKMTLKILPEIAANESVTRDSLAEESRAAIAQNFRTLTSRGTHE